MIDFNSYNLFKQYFILFSFGNHLDYIAIIPILCYTGEASEKEYYLYTNRIYRVFMGCRHVTTIMLTQYFRVLGSSHRAAARRHATTPQIIYTKLHAATPQKFGINDLRRGGMPLPDDCTLKQLVHSNIQNTHIHALHFMIVFKYSISICVERRLCYRLKNKRDSRKF